MAYRLGVDVGTNSIGWAILNLNKDSQPDSICAMGSRIFSDGREPKTQASLAVARRTARQARRRRDRFLQRKKLLRNQLIKLGLFPPEMAEQLKLKSLDVLKLRASAVMSPIQSYELGRVLWHLNQKRGFKSGRKEVSAEDAKNKISERMADLENQMKVEGARSYGEFLYLRSRAGKSTRATIETGFYPNRLLLENEFDKIISIQSSVFPNITPAQWNTIRGVIFHQRPLRPVERGFCSVYQEKPRAFRYSPSFELYRALCEVWNLRYRGDNFSEHELTTEQKRILFNELTIRPELKFDRIRKLLKLEASSTFSIEERSKIVGCPTAWFFQKKDVLGPQWSELSLERKDLLAEILVETEDIEQIRKRCSDEGFSEQISNCRGFEGKLPAFSEVTCAFSSELLRRIVELSLKDSEHPLDVMNKLRVNEIPDAASFCQQLEYYGKAIPESVMPIPKFIAKNPDVNISKDEEQYGRIANPTVHIGLNQIRRVVNEIINVHGMPDAIHVEFARDLKISKKRKDDLAKQSRRNQELNQKAREFIEEHGQVINYGNMERAKLWFEMENSLPRICIYTGKPISQTMVFSEQTEVDHILPFSRTLDDGFANKVLVLAEGNRLKKNRSPYEAFYGSPDVYAAILTRVTNLPRSKQWKFYEDAMTKFEQDNHWLARQLTDTSYLAKIAKKYLGSIVEEGRIVCIPGRLTALLRTKWGLAAVLSDHGSKSRSDHRHHAVDAIVIAMTDRSLLQRMSKASEANRGRLQIPPPWNNFFAEIKSMSEKTVVSHKMDHGKGGALLEETSFGIIANPGEFGTTDKFKLVNRRARHAATASKIRDPNLRQKAEKDGLDALPEEIRTLRTYDVSTESIEDFGLPDSSLALIRHGRDREHIKLYKKGDIHHLAVWRIPGKAGLTFSCIKVFDLNAQDYNKLKPHPAAKLVMKVHKRDTVAIELDGKIHYRVVSSIKAKVETIELRPVYFGGDAKDLSAVVGDLQIWHSFSKFKERKFRKIFVSPTGRVYDNGPIL